jgi:hypothetical protein
MQFYLIDLIYRNSRMSCVCLAPSAASGTRAPLSGFVFIISILKTAMGMGCFKLGQAGWLLAH